jgi:hypothetical protein
VDAFDDFEFKPLTDGLGFHKKNSQTSSTDKNLPPLEPRSDISSALNRLNLNPNSLNFDAPKFEESLPITESKIELPDLAPEINLFSKPLPRSEPTRVEPRLESTVTIPKFNPRFGKPLSNPAIQDQRIQSSGISELLKEQTVFTKETAKIKSNKVDLSEEVNFVEAAPSALGVFLDFTVIAGLSILFMLGLVIATRLDIVPILNNIGHDLGTQLSVLLLVYSVSQLYLILSRTFFGQTLGEWSMDTQLGIPQEQNNLGYILKLIARTSVLAITGFVVLPLASMFSGQDLAGRATGLKLYRK